VHLHVVRAALPAAAQRLAPPGSPLAAGSSPPSSDSANVATVGELALQAIKWGADHFVKLQRKCWTLSASTKSSTTAGFDCFFVFFLGS
jgi:hypothetical protein